MGKALIIGAGGVLQRCHSQVFAEQRSIYRNPIIGHCKSKTESN